MPPSAESIVAAFLAQASREPAKLCILFDDRPITYGALRRRVAAVAGGLAALGLQQGEMVALYLDNSPDMVAAYLGVQLAGGVVVLVNPQYRQLELGHILSDAGVRFCFAEPRLRGDLDRLRGELPRLERIVEIGPDFEDFLAGDPPEPTTLPSGDALAVLAYTSGTTGRSKGAMLLHRNLIANIRAVCAAWHWSARDHLLLALPLFHVHGLMVGVHGTLVSGASLELRPRFDPAEVLDRLDQAEAATDAPPITLFFGVPTMYQRLLDVARNRPRAPRQIRLYVSGSAPLSAQTFQQFARVFGQPILERYGMTETLMNLTNPYAGERRPGTVGQPFPGQEARVVDLHTRQPLDAGLDGEIEVRGPHVFAGYWQQPEATAASFDEDGWFRTGDLGQVSADGYFTITGRAKELIISGGYNVYPREVEEVLATCPGVAEVAVVGLPDPDLGEQVVAAVVRADAELSAEEVVAFCRDRLASYKKPRQVFFLDTLARNAMGKLQKPAIRDMLAHR
jgi:malonyl-CoA/methylmalonyl-CoA synthetase